MIKTDALIIGKGPAGIQAAVYLKRGNVDPLVIGKGIGASEQARVIDNFYGFPSIGGPELIERGIDQAEQLGIPVISDEVVSIAFDEAGYSVRTTTETYQAMSVLIATGSHRNIPRIKKIRNYNGKGVSYCAVCDGFFYRKKTVAVIGSADYAASEAAELVEIAEKVYVLTNGEAPTGNFDPRCEIITDKVIAVYGEEKVGGVELEKATLDLDGIFIAIGLASSTDLATKLGVEVQNGRLVVDEEMATNLPGLYAAGDCTPGVQQIAKAVSDGCIAGYAMIAYIRHKKRGM
ncbi:NAD(P)/FAD-dependent oxidoreductase [Erysipelothrix sp. HDW6C]|uniref:NAD(P)/FAD-dependent oxidoreductase n=1 Tax=Erysipelothrix sp. HDW6C TaxID=2714930 RepID=UPI00140BA203|nr:NAD(P)/FAD-dependent oxidoreductase [Erysipelothrix sp. HDW6C]QIK70594.1 NAD(P)/FAD-dependent oxidoreductase [Erysipelothrix sp. HDW6C]